MRSLSISIIKLLLLVTLVLGHSFVFAISVYFNHDLISCSQIPYINIYDKARVPEVLSFISSRVVIIASDETVVEGKGTQKEWGLIGFENGYYTYFKIKKSKLGYHEIVEIKKDYLEIKELDKSDYLARKEAKNKCFSRKKNLLKVGLNDREGITYFMLRSKFREEYLTAEAILQQSVDTWLWEKVSLSGPLLFQLLISELPNTMPSYTDKECHDRNMQRFFSSLEKENMTGVKMILKSVVLPVQSPVPSSFYYGLMRSFPNTVKSLYPVAKAKAQQEARISIRNTP